MVISHFSDAPNVVFFPQWGSGGALLSCEFGWDDRATNGFVANDFESLRINALPHQKFELPDLGEKANRIKTLYLTNRGAIEGLGQFKNIESMHIDNYPRNGIDFSEFSRLRHISTTWEEQFSGAIFKHKELRELSIESGFPDSDCTRLGVLPELRYAGFTQGSIERLRGLGGCSHLESLGLALARKFYDLGDLSDFGALHTLVLVGLPKLERKLELARIKSLKNVWLENLQNVDELIKFGAFVNFEEIYIVKCPKIVVDLSGVGEMPNLRKLFLNVPHINLDLDEIFSRKMLSIFQCKESDDFAASDESLLKRAEQHGRKISSLHRAGPRKSRCVQIVFDDSDLGK